MKGQSFSSGGSKIVSSTYTHIDLDTMCKCYEGSKFF